MAGRSAPYMTRMEREQSGVANARSCARTLSELSGEEGEKGRTRVEGVKQ